MIGYRFTLLTMTLLVQPTLAQPATVQLAPVEVWQSFMSSSRAMLDVQASQRAPYLARLGAALSEDPVAISDELERGSGGKRALRAYAQAMLEDGNLVALTEQLYAVMHGGSPSGILALALNTSEHQDGSVWFPQAEQAGFFAGALAAVFDGRDVSDDHPLGQLLPWTEGASVWSDASETMAARFNVRHPLEGETAGEWMMEVFTNSASDVSVPAAQWFEKGFTSSYR